MPTRDVNLTADQDAFVDEVEIVRVPHERMDPSLHVGETDPD